MSDLPQSFDTQHSKHLQLKIYMVLIFGFLAILTGSVGSVIVNILKVSDISVSTGSLLPISRYLTCILAGFFISPYIVNIGYKKSILFALVSILFSSICMTISSNLITSCMFFVVLGLGYALCKTSLFSILKLIFTDKKSHMSFMSLMEGIYMVGVLLSFCIFSLSDYLGNWVYSYYLFIFLSISFIIATFATKIPEYIDIQPNKDDKSKKEKKTNLQMFVLFKFPIVIYFTFCLLSYIVIEKGVNDWLPTYNHLIFHIDMPKSILIAGIFSGSIAVGRLFYSITVRYLDGNKLIICFSAIALIVTLTLGFCDEIIPGKIVSEWSYIPLTAFILPTLGFFIGPICPILYSSILIVFDNKEQSKVSGLIIIVSGIGSIFGTCIVGMIINMMDKSLVLEFLSCVILTMLIVLVLYFKKYSKVVEDNRPPVQGHNTNISDA